MFNVEAGTCIKIVKIFSRCSVPRLLPVLSYDNSTASLAYLRIRRQLNDKLRLLQIAAVQTTPISGFWHALYTPTWSGIGCSDCVSSRLTTFCIPRLHLLCLDWRAGGGACMTRLSKTLR